MSDSELVRADVTPTVLVILATFIITSAVALVSSLRDAQRYIQKHKRLDAAIDAYYNDQATRKQDAGPSTTRINQLFDSYKDPDVDQIKVDGTIRLCEDLGSDPEDVALLALAYELKSPTPAEWDRKGWVDGWRALGADTLEGMRSAVNKLRGRTASDPVYFSKVYNHTFDYVRTPGARSLGLDTAIPFWTLLIPHGLSDGAIAHRPTDGDESMGVEEGWQNEYTDWWFEFLNARGSKGVSKDTWSMFLEFIRSIDRGFANYDEEAAWPSTIDDFVAFARERLGTS
ncbi:defective in Cullin neddylation protein 1 [Vararia minispora EC-137]|uniref:Defective in Cullin neddylation protein 1 n=1 Tax=Vararia minispora EC-137 TaxID=1314806 RepID=A0ACB8QK31_9AGAM|nr:defective in Cullin neddylation protein 1 [Vararia minispora EC-137]